jgi:ParB family transcriptional regulator, chromosome partitioning protein
VSAGSTKKTGLGKGFAALMPQNFDATILVDENEKVFSLELVKVRPNPDQPRQHFDEEALAQLAQSIKQHGIVQPLVVTPAGEGLYTIIAGERRWRAAGIIGLTKVPALVRSAKELEQLEIALIENVQRVDLSPLEQARSIERLHQQFNVTYEAIAERLGKAPSTINNMVRLLQLPKDAFTALAEGKITEGHARAILALKDDPQAQQVLLHSIVQHGWSVRQAERYVTSLKSGIKEKKAVDERVHTENPVTKRLTKRLETPVHIKRMAKGGRLEITFTSDNELERILSLLDK